MTLNHLSRRLSLLLGILAPTLHSHSAYADPAPYTAVKLYTLDAPPGFSLQGPTSGVPMDNFGQVVGRGTTDGDKLQAILWRPGGNPISLHPTNLTGYEISVGNGVAGNQQVGYGSGTATGGSGVNNPKYQALLWNGSAGAAVNLHPTDLSGFVQSQAQRTDGTHQVGNANFQSGRSHAILWTGTAASAVDLHPTQWTLYSQSLALDVDGNQQVGSASSTTPLNYPKPVLWTGSGTSAIDLTPPNLPAFTNMAALGIGGGQQVGYGQSPSQPTVGTRAILWSGTAASAVDLTPDGSTYAIAYDTNGAKQVGILGIPDPNASSPIPHAMMWSGTKESAVELHTLLPSGAFESWAYAANDANDVFGIAHRSTGYEAVLWIAPPHTASTNIPGGSNQHVAVAGRSANSGQVEATFPQSGGGELTSINSLLTTSQLAASTGAIDFALPNAAGLVQTWALTYGGSFDSPVTLIFHYDPSLFTAGINELDLQMQHYSGGQWVTIPGVVDAVANTISIQTDSFSPFALSVVPEPAGSFLVLVAIFASGRRTRKARSRATSAA